MRTTLRNVGLTFLLASTSLVAVGVLTPDAARAADDERRVLSARQATSTTEDLQSEYQKLAEQKRLESIDRLKALISSTTAEGDQKAEMLLRLADLYFQQGRYLYLQEMAAFDVEFEKCFNTEGCSTDKLKPDTVKSRDWQEKSVKLYEQILRNYPRYTRADEAIFYLASAQQDMGRREDAVEQFTALVKQYPESVWVPDAYVNIGEYYFETDNAYKALLAYKKATAYRESPMYGFANYKLAWCYYNVGEYGKAIDTMKAVVSYSTEAATSGGDTSKLQLQDEALRDLVRFFADAGELDEAYEYFTKLGKKDLIRDMLKRLASTYFEQGKFELCIETYRRLISENPAAADCPDYQVEIIKAYKKIGKKEETLSEIDRMLKTYGKDSAWRRSNASNTDAIKDADEQIELNLRQVAVEYHQQAKKLGTGDAAKEYYALAYKAYKVYLIEFPDGTHAYEVRYAFGELLYKIKRFDEAYEQYMAVVKLDPQGKHSRFCAESAIFAADEMVKKESKDSGGSGPNPGAGGTREPQPLTEWEQALITACAQYATLYPEDKKVLNVMYKSAYLLYNKFRFVEAADQFNKVIAMDPSSKEAEQAAHLILDSFKVNEDWANLKKNSKVYFDQQGLGSKTFKQEVYDIYERSSFKLIEVNLAKDNDKGKAADQFVAFYKEFPQSTVAAQSLNNASVYYYDTTRVGDAMKVRHILIDDPNFGPKTKYYYDQVAALGFDYETIAAFDKAAFYYEKLFSLYPKEVERRQKEAPDTVEKYTTQAADALYSAAVFRKAMGEPETAINNYKAFITAYPTDSRVNDVRLTIGKIWEEQEKWSEAANVYYGFYSKADKDVPIEFVYFARLRYGKALEAQGQKKKADEVYEETVALYKKYIAGGGQPGSHTEFVAEMMYILAEPKFEKYMALKIEGSGGKSSRKAEDKAIGASLKAKAEGLVGIEKVYGEIIGTGAGEWGLAGLVKLGQVYENMGESLKTSSVPFYLDEGQREMYTMALEDKVYPQKEKAVAAYSAALQKSYELTLYNDDTAFATRRLGELRPDDFPGLSETLLDPRYTSSAARTFDFEKEL